jgi:hypothetical protein
VIPPRDFKPRTASAELLRDLGILPSGAGAAAAKPVNSLDRSRAAESLQRIAAHPQAVSFCMSHEIVAGQRVLGHQQTGAPTPGGFSTELDASLNWAGYQVDGTFDGAEGQWTVNESLPGIPTPNIDATWVGVGGSTASSSLIQVGTQMLSGHGYQSWFEYVGGNAQIPPTYGSDYGVSFTSSSVVHIGDEMSGLVYWQTGKEACFDMTNLTTDSGDFDGCIDPMPITMNRSSIEWIDEDPLWGDGASIEGVTLAGYLADFDVTNWAYMEAYNSSTGATASFTNYQPYYANFITANGAKETPECADGSDVMAYPGDPSSADGGSANNFWCYAGPTDAGY